MDGWQIEGCPVNGPAIDTDGGRAVVAWFTAANNTPKVKVAFSGDDGVTFGKAFEIDKGTPSGRVDVIQQTGLVPLTFRSLTSFMRPFAQKPSTG